MKLRAIHTYQYVRWQSRNENFISIDVDKFKVDNTQLTLLKEGVVEIKSDKDCILVFPTNIAYAVPVNSNSKFDKSVGVLTDIDPGKPVR